MTQDQIFERKGFFTANKGGEWREVEGMTVLAKDFPTLDLFIHKEEDEAGKPFWVVSEGTTGQQIAEGSGRSIAVESARIRLSTKAQSHRVGRKIVNTPSAVEQVEKIAAEAMKDPSKVSPRVKISRTESSAKSLQEGVTSRKSGNREIKERDLEFAGYKFTSSPEGTVIHRETVKFTEGDHGADPLGGGRFRMVPSGDIVDLAERNRRLGKSTPTPSSTGVIDTMDNNSPQERGIAKAIARYGDDTDDNTKSIYIITEIARDAGVDVTADEVANSFFGPARMIGSKPDQINIEAIRLAFGDDLDRSIKYPASYEHNPHFIRTDDTTLRYYSIQKGLGEKEAEEAALTRMKDLGIKRNSKAEAEFRALNAKILEELAAQKDKMAAETVIEKAEREKERKDEIIANAEKHLEHINRRIDAARKLGINENIIESGQRLVNETESAIRHERESWNKIIDDAREVLKDAEKRDNLSMVVSVSDLKGLGSRDPSKGFYARMFKGKNPDGSDKIEFLEVGGSLVTFDDLPGIEFFVRRDDQTGRWSLSEASTGLAGGYGSSRQDAIDDFRFKFEKSGPDKFVSMLEDIRKRGASPRYLAKAVQKEEPKPERKPKGERAEKAAEEIRRKRDEEDRKREQALAKLEESSKKREEKIQAVIEAAKEAFNVSNQTDSGFLIDVSEKTVKGLSDAELDNRLKEYSERIEKMKEKANAPLPPGEELIALFPSQLFHRLGLPVRRNIERLPGQSERIVDAAYSMAVTADKVALSKSHNSVKNLDQMLEIMTDPERQALMDRLEPDILPFWMHIERTLRAKDRQEASTRANKQEAAQHSIALADRVLDLQREVSRLASESGEQVSLRSETEIKGFGDKGLKLLEEKYTKEIERLKGKAPETSSREERIEKALKEIFKPSPVKTLDSIVSEANPVTYREFLKERAEKVDEENGVQLWNSANSYWVVDDGVVTAWFGYDGRNAFNEAVNIKKKAKKAAPVNFRKVNGKKAQTPRGLVMDRRRAAKTIAPETPKTEEEKALVERWKNNPSRLDRKGYDTPGATHIPTQKELDRGG